MRIRISTVIAVMLIINILGVVAVSAMPLEMSSERGTGDSWTITLDNVSDKDKSDVLIRACFYDGDGRLKKVKNYGSADIKSGESVQTEMELNSMDFVSAKTVKVLAWKGTEPQTEEIYLKGTKILKPLTDKDMATVWVSTEDNEIYKNGAEYELYNPIYNVNGDICFSARDISELFDLAVEWDSEAQAILIYSDKHFYGGVIDDITGFYDGEWYYMDAAPTIKDNMVVVPFIMIAELFECEVAEKGNSIAVYDEISSLVKYANENGLITDLFKNKALVEEITRGELASLVVNLYERVTGKEIEIETNSFYDTDDENALKSDTLGIINGYEDGTFRTGEYLTTGEIMAVLYRLLSALDVEISNDYSNIEEFDDFKKDDNHWAVKYTYMMKGTGVLNGVFSNTLKADTNISRKEAIALIANCYNIAK